jgi:hypothetical protein
MDLREDAASPPAVAPATGFAVTNQVAAPADASGAVVESSIDGSIRQEKLANGTTRWANDLVTHWRNYAEHHPGTEFPWVCRRCAEYSSNYKGDLNPTLSRSTAWSAGRSACWPPTTANSPTTKVGMTSWRTYVAGDPKPWKCLLCTNHAGIKHGSNAFTRRKCHFCHFHLLWIVSTSTNHLGFQTLSSNMASTCLFLAAAVAVAVPVPVSVTSKGTWRRDAGRALVPTWTVLRDLAITAANRKTAGEGNEERSEYSFAVGVLRRMPMKRAITASQGSDTKDGRKCMMENAHSFKNSVIHAHVSSC